MASERQPLATKDTNRPQPPPRSKSDGDAVYIHTDDCGGPLALVSADIDDLGSSKLRRAEQELVENRALLHRVLREKQQLLARCKKQEHELSSLETATQVFALELAALEVWTSTEKRPESQGEQVLDPVSAFVLNPAPHSRQEPVSGCGA